MRRRRAERVACVAAILACALCALLACGDLLDDPDSVVAAPNDAGADVDASSPPPARPAFFYLADDGVSVGPRAVFLDGTSTTPTGIGPLVGCPLSSQLGYFDHVKPGLRGDGAAATNAAYRQGMLSIGMHELAGFAYSEVQPGLEPDSSTYLLWFTTANGDCDKNKPVRIDIHDNPFFPAQQHVLPRISPNGKRVAYVDYNPQDVDLPRVITIGTDGTEPHVLRSKDTIQTDEIRRGIWFGPAMWTDDATVTWLEWKENREHGPVSVMQSADKIPSDPEPILTCPDDFFIEEAVTFSRGGVPLIAFAAGAPFAYSQTTSVLDVLVVNHLGACDKAINLTKGLGGNIARDITIDPRGERIAFTSNEVPGDPSDAGPGFAGVVHVWMADTNGSPARFPCSPIDPNADDLGPRFVDDGRRIVWTRIPRSANAPAGIWTANVTATACENVRPLVTASSADGVVRIVGPASAGLPCSFALHQRAPAAPATLTMLIGALVMFASRRRRQTHA